MHEKDLACLTEAISLVAPEYLDSYFKVMNSSKAHMLHMCIMSREKYNEYCEFVFSISLKAEELLPDRESHFIGAVSEFLMDVWIKKNHYQYTELGLVELEHQKFTKKIKYRLNKALINKS